MNNKTAKHALILAVILIIGLAVEVHSSTRDKLSLGVKTGLNLSNVYDSEGEEFEADPKLGLVGGVFLSIPIGPYLGVQPEILYSQKGNEISGSFLGNSYTIRKTKNYIDIPLLFVFKPFEAITFLAGPQYSYLINQKTKYTDSNLTTLQKEEFENGDIRENTLCFTGGIDLNFSLVVFSARVGFDLKENKIDGSSQNRWKFI